MALVIQPGEICSYSWGDYGDVGTCYYDPETMQTVVYKTDAGEAQYMAHVVGVEDVLYAKKMLEENNVTPDEDDPVLDEFDQLEENIAIIDDYDEMNNDFETLESELQQETATLNNMSSENAKLKVENSELRNFNEQLNEELIDEMSVAAQGRGEMYARDTFSQFTETKKETKLATNDNQYKDQLDSPQPVQAFKVHGKTFDSQNDALKFEIFEALESKGFTKDSEQFQDHAYRFSDEDDGEEVQLCKQCIPMDILLDNVDAIAYLLREYEQKKVK